MDKPITVTHTTPCAEPLPETAADCIRGGVIVLEPDEALSIRSVSRGCLSLLGFTAEQWHARDDREFRSLLALPDRERTASWITRQWRNNGEVNSEIDLETGDGRSITAVLQGRVREGDDGTCQLYGMIMETSSTRRAGCFSHRRHDPYRLAFEQIGYWFFDYDMAENCLYLSEDMQRRTALPNVIRCLSEWLTEGGAIHPESADDCRRMMRELRQGETLCRSTLRLRHTQEEFQWYDVILYRNPLNACPHTVMGLVKDITRQKQKEWHYQTERRFHEAVLSSAMRVYKVNVSQNLNLEGFDDWGTLFGIAPSPCYSDMIMAIAASGVYAEDSQRFAHTFMPSQILAAFEQGQTELVLQYRRACVGGPMMWVECTMNLLNDPAVGDVMAIAYIRDIHKQKQRELDMKHRAERDSLSQLYNHGTTKARISAFLGSEQGCLRQHALLLLDIDNFKEINDTYGHGQGDAMLSRLSCILRDITRSTDVVGRIGGDEFMLFLKNISSAESASRKAREIHTALAAMNQEQAARTPLSVSVGIALYPDHGLTFGELYQHADTALYEAKRQGKNCAAVYACGSADAPRPQPSIT